MQRMSESREMPRMRAWTGLVSMTTRQGASGASDHTKAFREGDDGPGAK